MSASRPGTDEHGLKMAQTARERGVAPAELAEEMSSYFKDMNDRLHISYDRFIRTTEPGHHAASQAIWQAMEANGDLYLDRYEGWYSVRDEAYYDEKELVVADSGERLSPQGTEVEWTVEESWFFRLSRYQEPLLRHYRDNPGFVRPEARRNEVMRFVEEDCPTCRSRAPASIGASRCPAATITSCTSGSTRSPTTSPASAIPTVIQRLTGASGRPMCTSLARTSSASTPSTGRPS
jgi:methionyl-tRNA synthetase